MKRQYVQNVQEAAELSEMVNATTQNMPYGRKIHQYLVL